MEHVRTSTTTNLSIFLWNQPLRTNRVRTRSTIRHFVSIFLWNHLQYQLRWNYSPNYNSGFNIPLKSSHYQCVKGAQTQMPPVSIFLWNQPLCWFLFWVLKFFLSVPRASWERVSASNAYGSCLFPRFVLEIELLFPRNFNPHGNDLFPR